MANMDEVEIALNRFSESLTRFNQVIRQSYSQDLKRSHDQVSPLWQDQMRKNYDQTWRPLEEELNNYIKNVSPRYVDTLLVRIKALKAYLRG